MDIETCIVYFEEGYDFAGIPFDATEREFLIKKYVKDKREYLKKALQIENVMMRLFFDKATRGELFGPIEQIENEFGLSIEDRYGFSEGGPFINLARTYWTFRLELDQVPSKYRQHYAFQILRKLDVDIAGIFFPTPGPYRMSKRKRKRKQLQILREYAPRVDRDRFFSQNPLV